MLWAAQSLFVALIIRRERKMGKKNKTPKLPFHLKHSHSPTPLPQSHNALYINPPHIPKEGTTASKQTHWLRERNNSFKWKDWSSLGRLHSGYRLQTSRQGDTKLSLKSLTVSSESLRSGINSLLFSSITSHAQCSTLWPQSEATASSCSRVKDRGHWCYMTTSLSDCLCAPFQCSL